MAGGKPRIFAILGLNDKQFNRGMRRAERSLNNFSRSATQLGRTMTTSVTMPIGLATVAAVKFAAEFEKSMVKIQTLVGIPKQMTEEWGKALLAMSADVARGPNELAKALFVVTSAGIRSAEALTVVKMAAQGSVVGLGDTATIARTLTAAMQAWSKEGLSASDAMDTLTATVRFGNVETEELAGSMGRVMGLAAQMGVSFQEVGAFIATYTRVGVDANIATTALRATLSTMLGAGEQAESVLERLGKSSQDVRDMIDKNGLAATLVGMTEKFKDNTSALREMNPNIRAMAGILAVASSQAAEYLQIEKDMLAGTVKTTEEFAIARKTIAAQWDQMKSDMERLGIVIGNILQPAVIDLMSWVKTATVEISHMNEESVRTAVVWAGIAAAVGPLALAVGAVTTILQPLLVFARLLMFTKIGLIAIGAALGWMATGAVAAAFDVESVKKFNEELPWMGSWQKRFNHFFDVTNSSFSIWISEMKLELMGFKEWMKGLLSDAGDWLFGWMPGRSPISGKKNPAFQVGGDPNDPFPLARQNYVETQQAVENYTKDMAALEKEIGDAKAKLAKTIAEGSGAPGSRMWGTTGASGGAGASTNPEADRITNFFDEVKESIAKGMEETRAILEALQKWGEGGDPMTGGVFKRFENMTNFFKSLRREQEDAMALTPADRFNLRTERGAEELKKMYDTLRIQSPEDLARAAEVLNIEGDPTFENFKKKYLEVEEEIREANERIRFNMGEMVAGPLRQTFTGILRGTRDAKDFLQAFSDTAIGIFGRMFETMIKQKLDFDFVFEKNFLEELPNILRKGVDSMGKILGDFFNWAVQALQLLAQSMGLISGPAGVAGSVDQSGAYAQTAAPFTVDLGAATPRANYVAMATGGITTGKRLAMVGDNPSGREAIIPLERWKEVMGSAGGGAPTIEIHSPSPLESKSTGTGKDGQALVELVFQGAKQAVASDIMDGGVVSRSIQAAFSTNRKGGR